MNRIVVNIPLNYVQKAVVAIGNFDGVHIGHQQLFAILNKIAARKNYRRIAITFEPLPREYFSDQKQQQRLPRLSLLRDKFYLLNNLIDELIVVHFNSAIANLTPAQFIQNVLQRELNVAEAVFGHDFKFGKNGLGSSIDLIEHGIECTMVDPVVIKGMRVSSSIVRNFAHNNDLDSIRQYLGHNLHYTSRIVHGNKMGRKFGVPTINLTLGRNRLALWGIYVVNVYINNIRYNAVASIGKNPTTNDLDVFKLEAHLLDVDLNLYGKIATVEILEFVRKEQKFDDLASLFAQIHKDMDYAKNYFKKLFSQDKNGL
ncbi:MAG: riboflavin biosynthesis protein RibF [Burkholderiales bacterium]|nr:riboflavin biosynthesis protein RibF [Burkholderiales bacterium]